MSDKDKLEPGDLAIIIKSLSGKSVGKIVECVRIEGNHPAHGIVWWVKAPNKLDVFGIDEDTNMGLCAQDWLRKIPKDPLDDEDFGLDLKITETDDTLV